MQTSEDYFINPVFATIERIIRYASLFISMLLPGIYVALVLFHQKMLPIEFILSSLASRQLIALPVFLEILLMSIVFELLREASIRVQSGINQTLGIVGGLILGQAAVSANLVSPIAIIVVSTADWPVLQFRIFPYKWLCIMCDLSSWALRYWAVLGHSFWCLFRSARICVPLNPMAYPILPLLHPRPAPTGI